MLLTTAARHDGSILRSRLFPPYNNGSFKSGVTILGNLTSLWLCEDLLEHPMA